MKQYTQKFTVRAPLERVAEFHSDPHSLKLLTPPPLIIAFNDLPSTSEGGTIDFTMWLGPIPVRWVSLISNLDPMHGFTDSQVEGPFDHWLHRHTFKESDEHTTVVIDEIQAQFGSRFTNKLISWFMWINLPILFAYRKWRTRVEVENKQ